MKLYNTLTRQVEEVEPLNKPAVTVYTCGPTVYDYPHIGNWFTFIRYDILLRTLKANGYEPKWVMNITDVGHLVSDADEGEDKLEKGAKREGKTAWDIAKFYSDYFVKGLERLNFVKPDYLPKATEHIEEQIALIKKLEQKGYTYIIDDGVYYDTTKFEGYSAFARLDLDEQQAGARVAVNPQKKNPNDFALWKFSPKDHQRGMEWDSPWGKGFPGWHIECSAIAMKYLSETLDIHSGGIDHVPVHHTNEIAQSEAATSKRFANYWMHTNHILIDDEKISKSLGNTITLEDIEKKGYSLDAFRLLVLESHYRTQSKFSWEALEAAQNRLNNLKQVAALQWQSRPNLETDDNHTQKQPAFIRARDVLVEQLSNDLATPDALATINDIFGILETNGLDEKYTKDYKEYLEAIDTALGLSLSDSRDISSEQKEIVARREDARKNKDFAKSDELRDTLAEQGIGLRDTEHGPIWYRL